jgi:SET domain-containing protein
MSLRPPSVYVKDTGTPKGRGVFAGRAFGAGEVVEECPVVLIRKPYEGLHKELKTFVFYWEVPGSRAATQALALGYGSLYNHANPSNMRYEPDGEALLMRFVAVRDIRPDEELTINYNADGGAAASDEDWWFEEKKIELLPTE